MGIKKLMDLIKEKAPAAVREKRLSAYSGQKVAIDASMVMYQSLIAIRMGVHSLCNEGGGVTTHLMGMFYRTVRMLESGVTPVYVFDGDPPEMKRGTLARRQERREAVRSVTEGEQFDEEGQIRMAKISVKVTSEHRDACCRLLTFLGVPWLIAPSEAEAYCAFLCKQGYVDAISSDDMDSLAFGGETLLRNFGPEKKPVVEVRLKDVLRGFGMEMDSFIDLCILLGCDYSQGVKGVGMKRAFDLIKKHGKLERIGGLPEDHLFREARDLFVRLGNGEGEPTPALEELLPFEAIPPRRDELISFMVKENSFDESKVVAALERIKKVTGQKKIGAFFSRKHQ
jgi:flap endonuclease-1